MADPLQIHGIGERPVFVKRRSPAAPALLWLVTFGIYTLYWYYEINREMRDFGRERRVAGLGTSPVLSLLAVTFGALLIVPAIVSNWRTTRRIKTVQSALGLPQLSSFLSVFLHWFFFPAKFAYLQSELNNAWCVASGVVAAGYPAQAPALAPAGWAPAAAPAPAVAWSAAPPPTPAAASPSVPPPAPPAAGPVMTAAAALPPPAPETRQG